MKFVSKKVSGDGRGRTLGYPTINLIVPENFEYDPGVFAVWVKPLGVDVKWRGLMHFGPRPTFNSTESRIEIFVMDNLAKKYESSNEWEVEIVEMLRPVMKFDRVEELISQIERDVQKGSDVLIGGAHP